MTSHGIRLGLSVRRFCNCLGSNFVLPFCARAGTAAIFPYQAAAVGGSAVSIAWLILNMVLGEASQLPAHQQAAFCACAESASIAVLEAFTSGGWSHLLCFLLGLCVIPAVEAIVWCRRRPAHTAEWLPCEEQIARRPQGRQYSPKRRDSSAGSGSQQRRR